jgi:hypothetical protein
VTWGLLPWTRRHTLISCSVWEATPGKEVKSPEGLDSLSARVSGLRRRTLVSGLAVTFRELRGVGVGDQRTATGFRHLDQQLPVDRVLGDVPQLHQPEMIRFALHPMDHVLPLAIEPQQVALFESQHVRPFAMCVIDVMDSTSSALVPAPRQVRQVRRQARGRAAELERAAGEQSSAIEGLRDYSIEDRLDGVCDRVSQKWQGNRIDALGRRP